MSSNPQTTRVVKHAPAKVNLYLEILGRRSDGFHEIETLMAKIRIFDTIVFESLSSNELRFELKGPSGNHAKHRDLVTEVPRDSTNLVVRAIELLRKYSGTKLGASVHLHKRIPTAAGLGGGSSDAASALLAANQGWQLGLSVRELHQLAEKLGSDIPFFLYPSPAICRGRGEDVETVKLAGRLDLVVIKPPVELFTANVYNKYVTSQTQLNLRKTGIENFHEVELSNHLQPAAESLTPWIRKMAKLFDHLGVPKHQMTGSGSAYFGICGNAVTARRIASFIRQTQKVDVYCTTVCN